MGKKTKISNFCFLNKLKCCIFAAEILLNCIRLIKTIYINNKLKQKIMKKFFTSIVIALCAMSMNAQETVTLYHPTSDKGLNELTGADLLGDGADGWTVKCMKEGKSLDQAAAITVGENTYRSIKVSNGAQTKVILPAGKIATKVTIYSYVNIDAANRTPYWKEVNGVAYTEENAKIMTSYKDGENPDVNTYDLGGVSEFTFTNTGEQPCVVLVVEYKDGTPSGISSVETKANENAPVYNLNGQKVSKDYKGVVVKNGKKYIQK